MVAGGAGGATAGGGGAAASKGAAAAGSGAAKAAGGGLKGWWAGVVSAHGPAVEQKMKHAVVSLQKAKLAMPVDVKIDFLNPTIDTIKASVLNAWVQLPPPVQQAAPFVGVAVGSGLVVFVVQQRRINNQRSKTAELELKVVALHKERSELLRRVSTLKATRAPRTDVEARLATAVAEVTNAAAAAADAAARAATACIIQRPQ